jgi:dienelactone hydrolase
MTFPTFDALNDQLGQLFRGQQYAQALELITREGDRFPDNRARVDYWRLCAAARVDDRALFGQVAEEALRAGVWYGEVLWRQTPSFRPLQGDPAFERLVAASRAVEARENPAAEPVLVTRLPADYSAAAPLLIALHGNQATAEATRPFWEAAVGQGWALALPQSAEALFRGAYVWDNLDRSRATVQAYWERLAQTLAFDPRRVVIAGHSLGGLVALQLALRGELPVAGFVANGPAVPYLDAPDELEALLGPARQRGLRGYLLLGANDQAVDAGQIHTFAARLRAGGIACKLEVVPGATHEYSAAYDPALRRALAFVDAA